MTQDTKWNQIVRYTLYSIFCRMNVGLDWMLKIIEKQFFIEIYLCFK